MVRSIHKRDETVISVEVGSVIKGVLDFGKNDIVLWRLVKPIIFDLLDFGFAMSGKLRKSADGITFLNPELKPGKLVSFFDVKAFPNKSFLAVLAFETLLTKGCKSIAFDVV